MRLRTDVFLACLTVGACRPREVTDLPICLAEVAMDQASEASAQAAPFDVWLSILIPGFDRSTLRVPDAPHTCGRQPLEVRWPEGQRTPAILPPRPLTAADVTFGEGPAGQVLIWVRIATYDNGEAMGPVALARWIDKGIEVRGIGTLVAPARRATLRLETVGKGERVLVVEGAVCPDLANHSCTHEAQILSLENQRFVNVGLAEGAAPKARARIRLDDHYETTQAGGVVRRYRLARRLSFGEPGVQVSDDIRIENCDAPGEAQRCEEYRSIQDKRILVRKQGTFVTTISAWDRLMSEVDNPPTGRP